MQVRFAREEDAEILAQAEYATTTAEEGLLVARPGEIPVESYRRKIRDLAPAGLYWVIESQGRIVGHMLLDPMPLRSVSHIAHLTIVVHPGETGKGYGRRLLTRAIEQTRAARRIEKIELRVRTTNRRAVALYESLGFQYEGTLRRHIKLQNGYADDFCMALFLHPDADLAHS